MPVFAASVLASTAAGRGTRGGIPGTGLSLRNYAKKGNQESADYQSAALAGLLIAVVIVLMLAFVASWK